MRPVIELGDRNIKSTNWPGDSNGLLILCKAQPKGQYPISTPPDPLSPSIFVD